MKTIYIKFLHQNDVYAVNPAFNLVPPGESIPSEICPICGATLYLPVDLPEGYTFVQPMPELARLSKDCPDLVVLSEPDIPILEYNHQISYVEQQRLKRFRNVSYADNDGFALLVADASLEPVEHRCKSIHYHLSGLLNN